VIVAPFCRPFEGDIPESILAEEAKDDGTESSSEEDLSDAHVIAQHEAVLDVMKKKLSAYMEARQRYNDKKRGRPPRGGGVVGGT
jgi:hypothetical protein